MAKVFISTIPFGEPDGEVLDILREANIDYEINPYGKKITEEELISSIGNAEALIAGTEPIGSRFFRVAKNLKIISRVGVGVDNIDLTKAEEKGIKVTITVDAVVNPVAEYSVGLILSLARSIHQSNSNIKSGIWKKIIGNEIRGSTIGIVGAGRIGTRVIEILQSFSPKEILIYDPFIKIDSMNKNIKQCAFKDIIKHSQILSLHLPLNKDTKDLFSLSEFKAMRSDAILINTSRGQIVNENDLYIALNKNLICGAALDVYESEPYNGKLIELDNCLLSPHSAPMTSNARKQMEIQAAEEVINFLL